jgi:Flp pilus assembly protein TadB
MNIDRFIFGFAGTMIIVSLLLSWVHSPYWMWLTVFVGANLLQSSITGFCPAAKILKAVGVKSGSAF